MHQLSQGLKLGFQGAREGPSGSELVLWSVVVFDMPAVIAPQRPRRVSTSKRALLKGIHTKRNENAAWEEGDLRRARQGETFIHFALITFIFVGKLIQMTS